jgi:hypothetical protein
MRARYSVCPGKNLMGALAAVKDIAAPIQAEYRVAGKLQQTFHGKSAGRL